MKKIYIFILAAFCLSFVLPNVTEAKSYYYKSAKSGRFVQKSYYKSHSATTYRSFR